MAEELTVKKGGKEEMYKALLPQLEALLAGETDAVATMANVAAALKQTFGFFWTGFYVVKGGELVLAPFQGPVACTRITYGRGVCGTAWEKAQTVRVADVSKFSGHIACHADSKSEIVIPLIRNSRVVAVLDIDADAYDCFDETDACYLERICRLIGHVF
jgi:GAF domain-containing protein